MLAIVSAMPEEIAVVLESLAKLTPETVTG